MKRMIFIHGDKGGVGKSVFARGLLDHYARKGVTVDAYDSDKRNPDLYRFYRDNAAVSLIDLASNTAFDSVLDRFSTSENRALIDLAAGAGDALSTLVTGDIKIGAALRELDARATVVYVLSRSRPSLAALNQALLDFEGVPTDWIIVKNAYFGDPEKFTRYDNSKTRQTALAHNAAEIVMPELLDDLYDDLDQNSVPFYAAAGGDTLTFTNKRRIRSWLDHFDSEVGKAAAVL